MQLSELVTECAGGLSGAIASLNASELCAPACMTALDIATNSSCEAAVMATPLGERRLQACGTSWDGYQLASSGAPDCSGCGYTIGSYDDCAAAAASGAAVLGIGGLGGAEHWDGPPGCHIQDGSNFQFNTNMDGGSAGGHTPVCLASHACLLVKSAPPSPPPG